MPIWDGPKGYTLTMAGGAAAGHSPADSTFYIFATPFTANPSSNEASASHLHVDCPAGVIRGARFRLTRFGAETPSTEDVTIRIYKNSTTIVSTISSTSSFAGSGRSDWADLNVQHAVVRGDQLNCRMITPAWSTNPTLCFYQAQVYIEVS